MCGKEIKQEDENFDDVCWDCWDEQLTDEPANKHNYF